MRWERVEQLAARAPTAADLHFHRLDLVAARALRARGEAVPPRLGNAERLAIVSSMAAPVMLHRARASYGGRMALMKGPEVAMRYPDPALRSYRDIDLLVDDAPAAHRALLDAGFLLAGRWAAHVEVHHLQPLCWPGLPIGLELHHAAHFPAGIRAPAATELLAHTAPARFAGGIVETLAPAAHALVLAAHAWAHEPLARIGQLVDVALIAREADDGALEALARDWSCLRLWRTTRAAIDALLGDARRAPLAVRVLAPHLRAARERTVLERHVEELASPLVGLPGMRAPAQAARVLARRLGTAEEETWARKAARARRAIRNRRLRHSAHDARLPPEDLVVGGVRGLQAAPLPEPGSAP